ncbi:MAG: hypothetical protein AAB521_03920 [Patescibacteria group bacterium]
MSEAGAQTSREGLRPPPLDQKAQDFLVRVFRKAQADLGIAGKRPNLVNIFDQASHLTKGFYRNEASRDYPFTQALLDKSNENILEWLTPIGERAGIRMPSTSFRNFVNPDEQIAMNGVACLFLSQVFEESPDLAAQYKDKEVKPKAYILHPGGQRRFVLAIADGERKMVVKPIRYPTEEAVAREASDAGIGPKIYHSSPDWLAEELVEGQSLEDLRGNSLLLGNVLGKAHISLTRQALGFEDDVLNHIRYDQKNRRVTLIDWENARQTVDPDEELKATKRSLKDLYSEDKDSLKTAMDSFKTTYGEIGEVAA